MLQGIAKEGSGIRLFYDHRECGLQESSEALLETWCLQFGSTLKGRRAAIQQVLHIRQKLPVLVSQKPALLLFPTHSPHNEACIWINYHAVQSLHHSIRGCCLSFYQGEAWDLAVDYRTLRLQLQRCERYCSYLAAQEAEFLV